MSHLAAAAEEKKSRYCGGKHGTVAEQQGMDRIKWNEQRISVLDLKTQ